MSLLKTDYSSTLTTFELIGNEIDGMEGASAAVLSHVVQLIEACTTFVHLPAIHCPASPVL